MAKTNFTKVEGMLDEGLRKMAVEQLLDMTDSAKLVENPSFPNAHSEKEGVRLQTLQALQRDLKFLDKMDQGPYDLFGISKKTLIKYLKNPEALTLQEWQNAKETQIKVKKFRKDFEKNATGQNDDDLIQQQRKSHKTKRFNINDKWVPLS